MNNRLVISIFILGIAILAWFASDQPLIKTLAEHRVDFHTPVFPSEYSLPTHITGHLQIGPQQGLITVSGTSTVEQGAQLIIEPGTTLAMNEYSSIRVYGQVRATGTATNPVRFITNEAREENRNWNGILFMNGSNGSIDFATFHHASPSVSCAEGVVRVLITHTTFAFGNLAVFGPCSYTP